MADRPVGVFHDKLYVLQKRLKGERLFIRQSKEIIRSLNDNVADTSKIVYHIAWATRQHWRNLDRLVSGARVFPSECSRTAICIESSLFEDASKHLGYQDAKYGEFLSSLRENPELIALMLHNTNWSGADISNLTRLLLTALYGSCILKEDENYVLRLLKCLMEKQLSLTDDIRQYFCSPKSSLNGFTLVLRLYSELLFSSKLYLTAALHGAVMQIIVDDSVFLDLEINKVLNRLSPRVMREKFGEPGTPKSDKKMSVHIELLQACLVNLCKKFLKSLKDKIYCFPSGIRWILHKLGIVIRNKTQNDEKITKAILGHVLINFFICPAIINPEPYGVNSDAFISETARYNLGQVASILRSLALAEFGMKDMKIRNILDSFDKGTIASYVDAVLEDATQLNPLNEKECVEGFKPNAALMTENELKSLINFMKLIEREDNIDLKANGMSQLMELLPPLPRKWTKQTSTQIRQASSLPIAMQLKANPGLMQPAPLPKNSRGKNKKHVSLYDTGSLDADILNPVKNDPVEVPKAYPLSSKEEYDNILADLSDMIKEDEPVLVISFGNYDDVQPGTLPEDKILGLNEAPMQTGSYDIDVTEEERQKRTSTIILDAMKDLEGLRFHPEESRPNEIELNNAEFQSNVFDQSACSSGAEMSDSTPKSEGILIDFHSSAEFTKETFSSTNVSGNTTNDGSLIILDNNQTPEHATSKPHSVTDNESRQNYFPDLDISTTFNALNDGKKDSAFHVSRSATLGPHVSRPYEKTEMHSASSLDRGSALSPGSNEANQTSSGSILGSLNTILQQPTVPTPTSFKNTFDFISEESPSKSQEGRNVLDEEPSLDSSTSSSNEDSRDANYDLVNQIRRQSVEESGIRNDRLTSDSPRIQTESPLSKQFETKGNVSAKALISCVVDTKSDTMKQMKKEVAETDRKEDRKKSSGAWFKGKIATGKDKLRSVKHELKNRTKSDGQNIKKGQAAKVDRVTTEPQPQLERESESPKVMRSDVALNANQNVSEEIMEKYRNISSNHGLMEGIPHGDIDSSNIDTTTEFDEDFKFEDAKRKLRIVLCMADRSNFPSGALNCYQLLMTFLQAQLAEAINLQDRTVVAQLHETLRSIRQLPIESHEKLLDALSEDYKRRSPYISYLVRSKQGLLATLSHIEQVRKKIERDKAICSKYFTTVCVRLSLETPEKKREITNFGHKFELTRMVDEKYALLEEFLEGLYKEMSSDPTWVAARNEHWRDAKMATERTIMSKIYKAAFYPNGLQDIENDKIFHEHISRLSKIITVNHKSLQIRKVFQKEAPWPSAQTELLMINAYKTPADKLRCIHRCCIAIMNLLSMATPNQTSGADEFVPVLVYVLIRANPPNLLSTKQYINNFYENRLSGEEFYCWTQFSAAVEFVKSLK